MIRVDQSKVPHGCHTQEWASDSKKGRQGRTEEEEREEGKRRKQTMGK